MAMEGRRHMLCATGMSRLETKAGSGLSREQVEGGGTPGTVVTEADIDIRRFPFDQDPGRSRPQWRVHSVDVKVRWTGSQQGGQRNNRSLFQTLRHVFQTLHVPYVSGDARFGQAGACINETMDIISGPYSPERDLLGRCLHFPGQDDFFPFRCIPAPVDLPAFPGKRDRITPGDRR